MKNNIRILIKRSGFILILVLAVLFIQCKSDDKKIIEEMQKEADTINRQCPITVDPAIRLDSCVVKKDRVFAYYYTITNDSLFNIDQFKTVGTQNVKDVVLNSPDLARMRYLNITFKYLYTNFDGKVIHTIDITPDDYNK